MNEVLMRKLDEQIHLDWEEYQQKYRQDPNESSPWFEQATRLWVYEDWMAYSALRREHGRNN